MKMSRFTDSQIMQILKLADAGTSVPALCRIPGRAVRPILPVKAAKQHWPQIRR